MTFFLICQFQSRNNGHAHTPASREVPGIDIASRRRFSTCLSVVTDIHDYRPVSAGKRDGCHRLGVPGVSARKARYVKLPCQIRLSLTRKVFRLISKLEKYDLSLFVFAPFPFAWLLNTFVNCWGFRPVISNQGAAAHKVDLRWSQGCRQKLE